jgi:hypothetical protein
MLHLAKILHPNQKKSVVLPCCVSARTTPHPVQPNECQTASVIPVNVCQCFVGQLALTVRKSVGAMGEARIRTLRHARIRNGEYPCVYCGGTATATEPDHCPPRVLFVGKHRPNDLVFPSCKE